MNRFTSLMMVLTVSLQIFSQRKMENLGRGTVAVRKTNSEVFVSWRILGYEFNDSTNFNLYRNNTLIANDLDISSYVDNTTENGMYQVAAVVNGVEQGLSSPCSVTAYKHGSNSLASVRVPINNTPGYVTSCLWVGDLDGDGEYDFVVAKGPTTSGLTGLVEAYTRHGEFLWQLDCGPNSINRDNISPDASALVVGHGDNMTVYDINNDGFAEVIVRTAGGVIFGDGGVLEESNNSKQFISVLEGTTGKEIARSEVPEDFINIGPMNGHMGIAYLDGINPSVVWSSKNRRPDKGFNMLVTTWKWQNDSLLFNWKFNREASGLGLPDGHNIRIIDVDGDGKDEITPFGYALDDDGLILYNLGDQQVVHGDRFFIGDLDPTREGLEGYGIQQTNPWGMIWYYYDAKTGNIIEQQWEDPIVRGDYARAFVGDLDPRFPYYEFFTFTDGLYNVDGSRVTTSKPDSYPNLRIWWDGDVLSENLDNYKMTKWDYIADIDNSEIRLYTFRNAHQDPRKTPAFYGDILGDWREEAVYISDDEKNILIFTTVDTTTTKLYTLPHNPGYRNCFTTRGYYQGHMLDYYLGVGMEAPPVPNIEIINKDSKRGLPNGLYHIESAYSNMLFDTLNGISQKKANDKIDQVWQLIRKEGHYEVYSMAAHKYLAYTSDSVGASLYLADSADKSLFNIAEDENFVFNISPVSDSSVVIQAYDTSGVGVEKFIFAEKTDTVTERFIFKIVGDNFDCHADWKGGAQIDNCGVCAGGNTGYLSCSSVSNGLYTIEVVKSGMCIEQQDEDIIQQTCDENPDQVWRLLKLTDGSFYFLNNESKKYMNFEAEIGSSVIPGASTKMRLERLSNGSYFVKPIDNPDLGLAIENNSVSAGAGIIIDDTDLSDSIAFRFKRYVPATRIETTVNEFEAELFPNPFVDNINLNLPNQSNNKYLITLYNNIGNKVKSVELQSGVNQINLTGLPSGVYYVKIVSDQKSKFLKIIKQ